MTLFPTTLVGSYPQPEWLIDRDRLAKTPPARVRDRNLWRVPEPWLAAAQDDATLLAIKAQEEAGLDIITDGEIRRESYSNRFATALDGLDLDNPATVPGPFTMTQQAYNEHYPSEKALALAYAAVVNDEIRDLFAAGADIVQVDEPYMQAQPEKARQYGLTALNRALEGITGQTAVHICFGYAAIVHQRPSAYSFLPEFARCSCQQVPIETAQSNLDCSVLATLKDKQIMVGCIDLNDMRTETPDVIVARIKRALPYVAAKNVILAPDCGMKYLPRDVAFGKLTAMVAASKKLRAEFDC